MVAHSVPAKQRLSRVHLGKKWDALKFFSSLSTFPVFGDLHSLEFDFCTSEVVLARPDTSKDNVC